MKIERLIGILSVLLQKDRVTAPELAERFEVSRRTINRDIDELCMAGIPIVTTQGIGGGISIMDGFKMDRTILTNKDMQTIMAGLRSLDSVSGSHYYGQLMEKIQAGSSGYINGNESILIDLNAWNMKTLPGKIQIVQGCIEERKMLSFDYYSPKGETKREMEPYFLIFRWSNWYVWGYCKLRGDFRLFKLNRMEKLCMAKENYSPRKVESPDLNNETVFPTDIVFKAIFDSSLKWHLIEEYGIDSFTEMEDGNLYFESLYGGEENLLSWMLTCRDKVTVLEPKWLKDQLREISQAITKKYEDK